MTYSFTINGNQENPLGNPIPYTRTLKQRMTSSAARYLDWMGYVRSQFASQCCDARGVVAIMQGQMPITLAKGQKAGVAIKVYWANESHGDLDNVLKGILDSLFSDDKCVNALKASSEMSAEKKGRVEVIITISD